MTDDFSRQQVRFTDDVDLIVSVLGKSGWYQLRDQLLNSGFTEAIGESVNCRMRLGEMKVDFMPDDADALGFTNRWYKDALISARLFQLQQELFINVVSPPYFVATKLEAYKGRGNGDPLASHDVEDMLTLIDGRSELLAEIAKSPKPLVHYIKVELEQLLGHNGFEYAIQSTALGNLEREQHLVQRVQKLIDL